MGFTFQDSTPIRKRFKLVVFTNGCFDILHIGHVRYLNEARSLGSKLVVAINSDDSVKRLKGKDRPIFSQEHRKEMLLNLKSVDEVHIFEEDTPLETINQLRPDVLVKGGDYSLETIVGAKEVLSWGGQVKALKFYDGFSTTGILKALAK